MSGSPIAVVGLSALMPQSEDLTAFWHALIEGTDCLTDVPEPYWRIEDYYDSSPRAKDKTYGRRGGFVPPQAFDALAFGLPPSSLPATDAAQLLALLLAQRCLADADNGAPPRFDRSRTSVILGGAATTQLVSHMSGRMTQPMWREGMRRAGLDEATIDRACAAIADQFVPWQESTFPGLLGNVIAGRIANRFDLGGTNCVLDAACASSLAALSMAIGELRSGYADTVLTGGVDALNDILMFMCFSQTPALSLTGDCRPFSEGADGTMLGEGVGMLALRRLDDAERDGHHIYAVIRGVGSSSDGRAKSVYAPRAEGQTLALRRAYEDAGYAPRTVELMEAHGTGTVAGDAAEVAALIEVFGDGSPAWCALGSVKSQIGHTKAAAGAASLVKAILALRHRTLPPTIKVDRPNPALGLDRSAFYLNTSARPWFRRGTHPRRASVSSFGFGGSNFHVTVEEYRGRAAAPRLDPSPVRVVLLSGDDANDVVGAVTALAKRVRTPSDLAACARASHAGFSSAAPIRVALIVESPADLETARDEAAGLLRANVDHARTTHVILRRGPALELETLAFVFPGQGSQYVGMGRELAVHFEDSFEAWQRACDAMPAADDPDGDLGDVVFPPPAFEPSAQPAFEARLRATRWAQPALAAASLAQLALLDRIGLRPAAVAGHSFGELTALHAAGAIDADTLVRLARERGLAMESSGGADLGGMLAVAGDAVTVGGIVERHGDRRLAVANDNHPRQIVLSGPTDALRGIQTDLSNAGLAVQPLNVAAAFHSSLVAPAAIRFGDAVAACRVQAPRVPVIANATARAYGADARAIKDQLSTQLAQPVRFRETVETLYELGCRVFLEAGPGNVLTGLVEKCLDGRPHVAIALDIKGQHGVRSWWRAVGELAVLGIPLDLAALHALHAAPASASPAPSGPAVVSISGVNLGKPYPPVDTLSHKPSVITEMPQRPSISAAAASPTPPGNAAGDISAQILEAQRLTQQALLESFNMTLRGLGGGATLPVAPVMARLHLPLATPAPIAAQVVPVAAPVRAAVAPPAVTVSGTGNGHRNGNGRVSAATVLAIIADRTGYPIDVLTPEKDLEADLGIDSIKRVEILAAVGQKIPSLQPGSISPADIRRISDLLALLEDHAPDPQQAAAR